MKLAVWLPLVLPLLAAVSARRLAEWLPPRTATWLLTGSAVVLAAASGAALGFLALAATLRIPLVAAAGDLSLHALSRDDPSSLPLGLAAGALLAGARRPPPCAPPGGARPRWSPRTGRPAGCQAPGRSSWSATTRPTPIRRPGGPAGS